MTREQKLALLRKLIDFELCSMNEKDLREALYDLMNPGDTTPESEIDERLEEYPDDLRSDLQDNASRT